MGEKRSFCPEYWHISSYYFFPFYLNYYLSACFKYNLISCTTNIIWYPVQRILVCFKYLLIFCTNIHYNTNYLTHLKEFSITSLSFIVRLCWYLDPNIWKFLPPKILKSFNDVNFARFIQHTSSLSSNRRLANSKHTFPFWNKSKVEKSQTNLSNSEHTVPFWNQFTPNLKRSPVVDTALLHTHTQYAIFNQPTLTTNILWRVRICNIQL